MIRTLAIASFFATLAGFADAECANACNGHGKCTSYDMCICNRNWQANDCSERVCLYGLAHVDTPKGDLDMSGSISNSDTPVVDNHMTYPYGTTEQFPEMRDSDLNTVLNSAHQYMECSNKGKCERDTGNCACYDGYEGVSCQRASCPGYPENTCSGHGTCKTIKQLAAKSNSVYELWDRDLTMGCDCDPGYYGADCSQRTCKVGIDPLYLDDSSTVKYSVYNFATLSTATTGVLFTDGLYASTSEGGSWAIRFFDSHGEDWVTRAIPASATCAEVQAALEALPNDVIPVNSIFCHRLQNSASGSGVAQEAWTTSMEDGTVSPHTLTVNYKMSLWNSYGFTPMSVLGIDAADVANSNASPTVRGFVYRIRFLGNPGALKQPEIEIYLDGIRPSLSTLATTPATVITKVWTDGQQGESTDYFADHCDGVTATIAGTVASSGSTSGVTLAGMSATELALLKTCLGEADFTTSNNVDVYDWDFGTIYHPHLIKLIRTVTTYTDGGYYAAIYWDGSAFQIINPFLSPDTLATDNYEIYTTKGTLSMVSSEAEAIFSFASNKIYVTNSTNDRNGELVGGVANGIGLTYTGDVSCEYSTERTNAHYVSGLLYDKVDSNIKTCLNSSDIFTFLNTENAWMNSPYINLYTATSLITKDPKYAVKDVWATTSSGSGSAGGALDDASDSNFMTHIITTNVATNWEAHIKTDIVLTSPFRLYKFWPSKASQYTYVAECSNRGICNTETGLCECFPGYTSDSCHEQSSISL